MNKLLLAATLLTALSTPALAAYSKAQSELNPRGHVVSEPHRHRSSGMLPHRIERGEFNDLIGPLATIPPTGVPTVVDSLGSAKETPSRA